MKDYGEAIRLDPKDGKAFYSRGITWAEKKEFDKALKDCAEAIRLDPNYADAYCNRAWIQATCPEAKYRSGKQAVADATKACDLTEWKGKSNHFGTLAAAYAEAGDFTKAVKWQTKATNMAPKDKVAEYRARLKLYQAGKPYRDRGKSKPQRAQ